MVSITAIVLAAPLLAFPGDRQDLTAPVFDVATAQLGRVQLAQSPPVDPDNSGGAQHKPSTSATTRAGAANPPAAKADDKYMRQGEYDGQMRTRGLRPKPKKPQNIDSVK